MRHSVIIPCYNCANTLGEQLEALSQQVWDQSWEVIIADNGSSDRSKEVAAAYRAKLPNLRLIDASKRRGAAHARNQGAKAALGEQLSFIDADDVVAPGWLAALGGALGRYDFVASRHDYEKLNSESARSSRGGNQNKGLQSYIYPPFLPHAGGCGLGVKRWLHEALGGFDETFLRLQDTDYCWRIQLEGVELHFVPEAVIHVRYRTNRRSIYRQARENGEANVHLHKKYLPKGMPELSWKHGVAAWLTLLKTLPHLTDPHRRSRWLWQFGWRIGRLTGSLKYHVLSL